jgi:hypothetical protein
MKRRLITWFVWSMSVVSAALMVFAFVGARSATPVFSPTETEIPPSAMVLLALASLAFSIVGALVAPRHPRNTVGWLMIAIGVAIAGVIASVVYVALEAPGAPWAEWVSQWMSFVPFLSMIFILLLFPDGKALSNRWRPALWLGILTAAVLLGGALFVPYLPELSAHPNPAAWSALDHPLLIDSPVGWYLLAISMVVGAASFVMRFRRSAGVTRQQLRWFSLAAALVAAAYLLQLGMWALQQVSDIDLLNEAVVVVVMAFITVPVTSGIAILRYRLYDLDIIINRTLVYGALTGVLAAAYLGSVTLTQSIFLTQGSELSVATSTLLVAALFRPVRRRVQEFIDRRFYRRKYDAEKTILDFSTRLRDELDIDSLRDDLVDVVQQTMQPVSILLWLKRS